MAGNYNKPIGDMNIRVNSLLNNEFGETNRLAEICELHRNSIYTRLSGDTQFRQNEIIAICEHFNVSADWLLFGESRSSDNDSDDSDDYYLMSKQFDALDDIHNTIEEDI